MREAEQKAARADNKVVTIRFRVETPLAQRLKQAAREAAITPSDKLRRILDANLPPAA
jgi:hypothetical protein